MNFNFRVSAGLVCHLAILFFSYVSVILCLSSCRESNFLWITNAGKTLEQLERELQGNYQGTGDADDISLEELSKRIQMIENSNFEVQFLINDLRDYRLLIEKRGELLDRLNSLELPPDRFNPMIAYIDGKVDDRGYCSALFLDGVVHHFSRSALQELIDKSVKIITEARSKESVQEYPMNSVDSGE